MKIMVRVNDVIRLCDGDELIAEVSPDDPSYNDILVDLQEYQQTPCAVASFVSGNSDRPKKVWRVDGSARDGIFDRSVRTLYHDRHG